MLCDNCKKNPVAVHVTQVVNGEKTDMNLCQECAAEKGVMFFNLDVANFSLPKLFGTIFQGLVPNLDEMITDNPACPNCGMRLSQVSQQGRLGCSECYNAFEEQLEPALRRTHGHTRHVGRVPSRQGGALIIKKQIDTLKQQLKDAVQAENFELAAELRDQVKNLEKGLA